MNGTDEAPRLPMPHPKADHSAWMAYAVSEGMPEDMARGLTRDQIKAELQPHPLPLTGAPDLERHERDPETLAAIREGRRKPWQRT